MPRKKAKNAYHHGDLRRALVSVASDMLSERGVSDFSLREACRRAGVTIGAAIHHFGSSRGLLTAVATSAFERLCSVFEAAQDHPGPPIDQLIQALEGYAGLSKSIPGPFSIMFRWDLLDTEDPAFAEVGPRSYALLSEQVRRAAAPGNSERDIGFASDALWAAIHGLVDLGLLDKDGEGREKIGFSVRAVIDGMLRGATDQA